MLHKSGGRGWDYSDQQNQLSLVCVGGKGISKVLGQRESPEQCTLAKKEA